LREVSLSHHPIRRAEVLAEVERKTREMLAESGGAGRVVVEFDFNRGRAVCFRVVVEYGRKDLKPLTAAETAVG
jgi:hypothetical protein